MATIKTICVVTGSRAEFGLLNCLMHEIEAAPQLKLQTLVTGMHLSSKYGSTWKEIENEGFQISSTVDMLELDNSPVAVARSTGRGISGCAESLQTLAPDLVVVLGDRFETFAAAVAATFLNIPLAHFHGGETTEGAFDESFRHSITKMSHLHFTATEVYRQRVIQLGEAPDRVFNVGALGLDNIERHQLLGPSQLESELGIAWGGQNLLVTFHPSTLEVGDSKSQLLELMSALSELQDFAIVFTYPNADPGSDEIKTEIDKFVARNSERAWVFESLGYIRYLSMLNFVDAVVGNSSSGLIEAPHFHTPTVNIGDRQKGRLAGPSVIHSPPECSAIKRSIKKAVSESFQRSIQNAKNPYGEPGAAEKAIAVLESFHLSGILKKSFFDVDFRIPGNLPSTVESS